jgi:septum formation protein
MKKKYKLILASSSPRRIELLKNLNFNFAISPAHISEVPKKNEKPINLVKRLALNKALSIASSCSKNTFILSADTIVVFKNKILGKPKNKKDALQMLTLLNGNTHNVITGWCWCFIDKNNKVKTFVQTLTTKVKFTKASKNFLKNYINTKEPYDKAGSYAAQSSTGMYLIEEIHGSFSNVVGLPIYHVLNSFKTFFKKDPYELFRNK